VPWKPVELERLGDELRRKIEDQDLGDLLRRANEGDVCPFAMPGKGCRVYEERPLMCRLYGTVEDLRCPHGYQPKQLLTSREARGIIRTYANLIQGG
jgi:Fe-S-cluster containining protein